MGLQKRREAAQKHLTKQLLGEIQVMCSEGDLSEQYKGEKIHQIRQAAQERANAMISPAERQQLKACRRRRQINRSHATGDQAAAVTP